jgi:hypothetical protein
VKTEEIKLEATKRIVRELCEHSIYMKDCGLADAVQEALAKRLTQQEIIQLFNLTVIGRKEDRRCRAEEKREKIAEAMRRTVRAMGVTVKKQEDGVYSRQEMVNILYVEARKMAVLMEGGRELSEEDYDCEAVASSVCDGQCDDCGKYNNF